jgi:Thioesterase-like superfamily
LGAAKLATKKKWWAVTSSQVINYLKPIKLFGKFSVTAKLVGWDENFFFWENRFFVGEQLCTVVYAKVSVRCATGRISTADVLRASNIPPELRAVDHSITKYFGQNRRAMNFDSPLSQTPC